MNKKEFFEQRAKMHFEREHGITKCEEGKASGAMTIKRGVNAHQRRKMSLAVRMFAHTIERPKDQPETMRLRRKA